MKIDFIFLEDNTQVMSGDTMFMVLSGYHEGHLWPQSRDTLLCTCTLYLFFIFTTHSKIVCYQRNGIRF